MTNQLTADDVAALVDAAGDGRASIVETNVGNFRVRVEPDDMRVADDGDWFGTIEYVDDRRRDSIYPPARPAAFDGNAEKLSVGRGDDYWWQPPSDVERGTDAFRALRRALVDALEYGYSVYVLERVDGSDAYGRPIVRDVAALGGVEPFPTADYVADIVRDLLDEISTNQENQP